MTTNILILCTHNSARSILAEGMLNRIAHRLGRPVRGYSAGSTPSGKVNPFAIDVLRAAGVDSSALRSKSWDEFSLPAGPRFRAVITVCDKAAQESCPFYPGSPVRIHWGYPDPSNAGGAEADKRAAFELTRQAIGYRMLQLVLLPLESLDDAALRAALSDITAS